MKKFTLTLLALLLIAALSVVGLPASAQQQTDLTTLARYYPADAPLYASFRTDDTFIQTLDSLASQFGALVPGGVTPGSLQELLDQVASDVQPGGTFATTIRPWLGDSAAFGLYNLTVTPGIPPLTLVLSIADEVKAEAFFNALPNSDQYTVSEGAGFGLYTPAMPTQPYFVFRSDAVIITYDQQTAKAGGVPASTLADNPDFSAALALLPGSPYDGVAYADTPTILTTIMQASQKQNSSPAVTSMVMSAVNALKPEAFGLSLLDNRSLVMDIASPINPSASTPLTLSKPHHPIDPSFAQHIPSGTPLVVQGTDLYDNYQEAIANLQTLAQAMPTTGNANPQDIQTALWGLNFIVRGLTGMDASDALGWATGDYALYMGFTPAFAASPSVMTALRSMPLDFGVTVAATDAAAAQKVFDGLSQSLSGLPAQNVKVTQETLDGGIQALVFTIQPKNLPYPVEILAATGNGVFTVGTRTMVMAALNPQGAGVTGDPAYMEASKYLLQSPSSFTYVNGSGMQPLAKLFQSFPRTAFQGHHLDALLSLLSSGSISRSALPDNGGTLTRLVWTLPPPAI